YWDDFSLLEFFETRLNLPVVVGNDASLAALGEYRSGAGQGVNNMVYITLSTGIGGGLIVDGDLYVGRMGFSGEIGHISVEPDGYICNCGNRGCLELYASGPAILRQAIDRINNGDRTSLRTESDLTSKDIFRHASEGDIVSNEIVTGVGKYLGKGVVSIMNMFEPERIVFGGGVSESFDLLRPHIIRYVQEYSMAHFEKKIDLRKSEFKENSSLIGAAYYALLYSEQRNVL
ncbi:MAG: ROK family protein, partial [Dehalococcoidia bacterium]